MLHTFTTLNKLWTQNPSYSFASAVSGISLAAVAIPETAEWPRHTETTCCRNWSNSPHYCCQSTFGCQHCNSNLQDQNIKSMTSVMLLWCCSIGSNYQHAAGGVLNILHSGLSMHIACLDITCQTQVKAGAQIALTWGGANCPMSIGDTLERQYAHVKLNVTCVCSPDDESKA